MSNTKVDIQQQMQSLHTLQTQMNENELVLKELELIDDNCQVFKVRGVGLTLEEGSEAISNVKKRIEFISKEKERVEKIIEQYKKDSQSPK